MATPQPTPPVSNSGRSSSGIKKESVRFLQLVCIFTDLVPKILLDVFRYHIALSKAFQERFGSKPWDGSLEHREWLASIMEKNPRVQDFVCTAVRKKPPTEWDVTNLSAVLSVVMEPLDVPCDVAVTQGCSRKNDPIDYFKVDVSVLGRTDWKAWEGFSINVTGASSSKVVECVVTKALSDTQVVAVCRERANDHDLPKKIKKYMTTKPRPVHLPLPEVRDIVKVRQSRNNLYHRSKTEVSDDEFTRCVTSVRCLIEQVLCHYIPKGDSDGYLAKLDRLADVKDFRRKFSDGRAVLELFQKALNELKHVMEELGEVGELHQQMDQQAEELLRDTKLLKTELMGVLERLNCLEGKVFDLWSGQESQTTAIQYLQSGQDSLSQRMERMETQPRVVIDRNTSAEGSNIHISVEVAAGQGNGGYPCVSQLHVPDIEQTSADLFKENVFDAYCQFKLEGRKANANYVKLAVVKRSPSSTAEEVVDKIEATWRFKHCGPRMADENATHITPFDLLKKGSEQILVVYGQAGSGKTTLLKQMCKALSRNKAKTDFDLVLYFPLRDKLVSNAHDLPSLLKYYGSEGSHLDHVALAQSMVHSKGKGLLLVFDGADEVKDVPPIIHLILQRRLLLEAHIVISSRPGACPSLQDYSGTFYEVQGFDHAAIASYVKGFFEATPAAADKMLSQLETRPDLMAGAYIPMNCFILCSIFDSKSASFPATITSCYQAFASHTISREYKKEGREVYIDPTLKGLPEEVSDLMMSLSKLAFHNLCHNPPNFVFNESSIRAAFPKLPPGAPINESLFKGLLHVHASRQGYQSFVSCSFSHATQQEFFAALHLSHLPAKEQARFWQKNLSKVSFSVVLRLYAGLTGLGVPKVAKQLCSAAESHGLLASFLGLFKGGFRLVDNCNNANPQLLFLFHALCESHNLSLTREVMQHAPCSLKFTMNLSAFDTIAIAHCLCQSSRLKLLELPHSSCTLLSVQCLSHLKAVLQANPQCQLDFGDKLNLSCEHFSADDAQTLSRVAVSLKALVLTVSHIDCTALSTLCSLLGVMELEVSVNSDVKDDGGWPLLESSLAKNKHLESLELGGCDDFLLNMGKALTKNTSIRTLRLFRLEPLPDDVACAIATCVATMTQLRCLTMHELSLPVLKVLSERMEPLEYLGVFFPGVNWNGFSEDEWKEIEAVAATAKVREVYLQFDVTSRHRPRAVQSICEGFVKNSFIGAISLCEIPEEMVESVGRTLQTNSDVKRLLVNHKWF